MTPSITKVFEVGELLEQILMNDAVSAERLFALQRVNKHFHFSIANFSYLQRKMRLRHLTPKEANDTTVTERVEPLLSNAALSMRPFGHLRPEHINHTNEITTLIFSSNTDLMDFAYASGATFKVAGRKHRHGQEESWSKRLFVTSSTPVQVCIKIQIAMGNRCRERKYSEVVEFRPADATLRNLFRVLHQVMKRDRRQHLHMADRSRECPHQFDVEEPTAMIQMTPFAAEAEKVFAIPELLENILVGFDARRLFCLQRVNSTFKKTIRSSPALMGKMQLRHQPLRMWQPQHEGDVGLASALCRNGSLIFDQFLFREASITRESSKELVISFDCISRSRCRDSDLGVENEHDVGLRCRRASRTDVDDLQISRDYADSDSWRRIKLSPVNAAVDVAVHVRVQVSTRRCKKYTEVLEFQPGDGTLGDLSRFLEEIAARTHKSHARMVERGPYTRRKARVERYGDREVMRWPRSAA